MGNSLPGTPKMNRILSIFSTSLPFLSSTITSHWLLMGVEHPISAVHPVKTLEQGAACLSVVLPDEH
jgi:hypothetical protein